MSTTTPTACPCCGARTYCPCTFDAGACQRHQDARPAWDATPPLACLVVVGSTPEEILPPDPHRIGFRVHADRRITIHRERDRCRTEGVIIPPHVAYQNLHWTGALYACSLDPEVAHVSLTPFTYAANGIERYLRDFRRRYCQVPPNEC